ncbi:MAG: hypothetical protein ACRDGN_18455, partial [bacterium]
MGELIFFIDDHLSVTQYPLHVLTPSEEAAGAEAFRVADGRRSPLDRWTGVTLNTEYSLKNTMDRVRSSDMVFLDRGYVVPRLIYEVSDDNFTTTQSVFDITLPTVTATGSVDDALGVRTEEGAWIKRFPARTAKYERFRIPAMGAGLKPSVVGLKVGLAWLPGAVRRPFAPDRNALIVTETSSDSGWLGRGRATSRREAQLNFKLTTEFDYAVARYHLGLYDTGKPAVIVPNDAQAERAFMALRLPSAHGLGRAPDWFYE